MRSTLLFAFFLSFYSGFTQPSLNLSDFGANLNSTIYNNQNGNVFSYSQAGDNITWNFSNMNLGANFGTVMSVPLSSVPFADSYPQASYATYRQTAQNSFYYLYSTTENSINRIGMFTESGVMLSSSGQIEQQIPLTFMQTFGTRTYDAYGTLITPMGTFSNVFRIKDDKSTATEGGLNIAYHWYATNPCREILTVHQYCCYGPVTEFFDYGTLNTETSSLDQIAKFADAETKTILIKPNEGYSGIYNFVIYNLMGQEILCKQNLEGISEINHNLNAAVYIVQILDQSSNLLKFQMIAIGQ